MNADDASFPQAKRAETLAGLRRMLSRPAEKEAQRAFRFGIDDVDRHLPDGGLTAAALHEIAPRAESDIAAAVGFLLALLGRLDSEGPLLWIGSSRVLADCGELHGHGLQNFGFDPGRLILIEAGDERSALWAMEEAVRSSAPAAVAGSLARSPDLKTSRRLHLAAETAGLPLLLLGPATASGSGAERSRWRIRTAGACRDRFGLVTGSRWHVELERCRNGRPGEWVLEWDHAAYRFHMAGALADRPLPCASGETFPRSAAGRS